MVKKVLFMRIFLYYLLFDWHKMPIKSMEQHKNILDQRPHALPTFFIPSCIISVTNINYQKMFIIIIE